MNRPVSERATVVPVAMKSGRQVPALALGLGLALSLSGITAAAAEPYRTVVDKVEPAIDGLVVTGAEGSCTVGVLNRTGADVILFDTAKRPLTIHPYQAPQAPPNATLPAPQPSPVHLLGDWPCGSLPAITEDQRWYEQDAVLLEWSINGSAKQRTFTVRARTLYQAADDPSTMNYQLLRYGALFALAMGVLFAVPYMIARRREIFRPPA